MLALCYSTTAAAPEQIELLGEPAPALAVDWDTQSLTSDDFVNFLDILEEPFEHTDDVAPSAKRARTDDATCTV
jgi:hypothetical protein